MIIRDWMKPNVISISQTASIRQAALLIVEHHIGELPVVDEVGRLKGIISLEDLLTLELPDFFKLIPDLDFVHNYGAVETTRPSSKQLDSPITSLMEQAQSVNETSGLLRTYALMLKHNLQDIPIVNANGELVGIASRVDIGTAVLSSWKTVPPSSP
jgi:CBS domain-containing protein